MKKTLIALAALGAMAGAAQAQSTVTIYGLLDANFQSFKTNVVSGATIQSLTQTKIDGAGLNGKDRKSTRLNSSHIQKSRMPSSA